MRADRLLSLLMLLQTRGTMTARQLAGELEVSERTIYRDLTALNAAGVPVYAERGPGGGCRLVEEYRTSLTGLTADEARALSMLDIPASLLQLGVGRDLRAALLKMSAALPASRRDDGTRTRQRIYLDPQGWSPSEPLPHLSLIRQALWQDRMLRLVHHSEFGTRLEQVIAPYGLAAKADAWYLVGAQEDVLRVLRVSLIEEVCVLDEMVQRPADFDLAGFWGDWSRDVELNRFTCKVRARFSPVLMRVLPRIFGAQARAVLSRAGPPDDRGWQEVDLEFDSFEEARTRLLGLGNAAQVLEPAPLRESVVDFARQLLSAYEPS